MFDNLIDGEEHEYNDDTTPEQEVDDSIRNGLYTENSNQNNENSEFDSFDDSVSEIDFSEVRGDFRSSFSRINKKIKEKQTVIKSITAPEFTEVIIEGKKQSIPYVNSPQKSNAKRSVEQSSIGQKKFFRGRINGQGGVGNISMPYPSQLVVEGSVNNLGRSKLRQQFPFDMDSEVVVNTPNSRIIVPARNVIVEGVSDFILDQSKEADSIRNIGFWKGKKLEKLILVLNNDSAIDFSFSLFNPSMPLDYLYSTSLSLNDKIDVAGGQRGGLEYTDVLFNILANPMLIRQAQIVTSGARLVEQQAIALQFQDKCANGTVEVMPLNLALKVDTMQVFSNTVSFDLFQSLNRPYIPDGMHVINYTVLAGNTVTMCFYYEQMSLAKLFYKEARIKKKKVAHL
jgi:hypothetical protein